MSAALGKSPIMVLRVLNRHLDILIGMPRASHRYRPCNLHLRRPDREKQWNVLSFIQSVTIPAIALSDRR